MNYREINIDQIKIGKGSILYRGKKLIIKTPRMITPQGLEQDNNKFFIKLVFDKDNSEHQEFKRFLLNLEEKFRQNFQGKLYKSQIQLGVDGECLILKVPYRYRKIEMTVNSSKIYLPTSYDIKEDMELEIIFNISKLWIFQDLVGSLMEIKEVNIL